MRWICLRLFLAPHFLVKIMKIQCYFWNFKCLSTFRIVHRLSTSCTAVIMLQNEQHDDSKDHHNRSLMRCYDVMVEIINSLCCCCSVAQLSHVWFFVTPWTAAHQASLPFTISQSLLKLMSIEPVMPSNHLILCPPLLLLPSAFPSISVFSNQLALCINWPKYWSFSISPSNEYSGMISFRIENRLYASLIIWKGLSCKLSHVPLIATLRRSYFNSFYFPSINPYVFLKLFIGLGKVITTFSVRYLYRKSFIPQNSNVCAFWYLVMVMGCWWNTGGKPHNLSYFRFILIIRYIQSVTVCVKIW